MKLNQERKYDALDGKIVNRSTGKPIPDDEPIIIFRAKDLKSIPMLEFYKSTCNNAIHRDVIQGRIDDFSDFQEAHPERCKEPDSSPHCIRKA